jgi:hypothetical protein
MCKMRLNVIVGISGLAAGLLLLSLLAGCAEPCAQFGPAPSQSITPASQAGLPTGRWAGEGTFVYEEWKAGEGSPAATKPAGQDEISRSYPTTLSIRPGELGGHPVILMEIESDRGAIPDLGTKTLLKAALVEAKRVSATTVLYRLVGMVVNPDPNESLTFDEQAPPYAASATTNHGVTTFQIDYSNNFTDVFRFRGPELDKAGSYYREDEGLIHWTEHLVRQSN